MSEKMVLKLAPRIKEHAAFYYNWFNLYALNTAKFLEVAIVGKDWSSQLTKTSARFIPYGLFLGGEKEDFTLLEGKLQPGKTIIYVCHDKTCLAPTEVITEEELKKNYLS